VRDFSEVYKNNPIIKPVKTSRICPVFKPHNRKSGGFAVFSYRAGGWIGWMAKIKLADADS
jgi:hypothetical protein